MSTCIHQFLLEKERYTPLPDMKLVNIDDYKLQYHSTIPYTSAKKNGVELVLLGNLFAWDTPSYTNQEILNDLADLKNRDAFFNRLSRYYGRYVLIYKLDKTLYLLNDACAQSPVYYFTDFSAFGSQVTLLKHSKPLEIDTDKDTQQFFKSEQFKRKKLFITHKTHARNVHALTPNFCINVTARNVFRFFPINKKTVVTLDTAVEQSARIIKGYLKAITHRYPKMLMPVTGGYDSRVLFLASLDLDCKYFVCQHETMPDTHYDIEIPKKLTAIFNKEFSVVPDVKFEDTKYSKDYKETIDFPRFGGGHPEIVNHYDVLINGNISEMTRANFGDFKNLNVYGLCVLNGYELDTYIIDSYDHWLKENKAYFKKLKYHYLDMFHWEEKSKWITKAKIESDFLGVNMVSPFNARTLINLLLSVDRKHRDKFENALFDKLIEHLSNKHPDVMKLPINPSKNRDKILLMKKFKIFKWYQRARILDKRLKHMFKIS